MLIYGTEDMKTKKYEKKNQENLEQKKKKRGGPKIADNDHTEKSDE